MRLSTFKPILIAAMLAISPAAQAATFLSASLSGAQEAPPNASQGLGSSLLVLSDAADTLGVSFAFLGLSGNAMGAGLYCCAPAGVNGGLALSLPGFVTGATIGAYSNTFNLLAASSYTPAFLAANGSTALTARSALVSALLGGMAYINISSTAYADGEIRGATQAFLTTSPVPEPSQWALLIPGLLLSGEMLRRQRRARRRAPFVLA